MGLAHDDTRLCDPHAACLRAFALGDTCSPAQGKIRYEGDGRTCCHRQTELYTSGRELCRQWLRNLGICPNDHHPVRNCGTRSRQCAGGSSVHRRCAMGGTNRRFCRWPALVGLCNRSCRLCLVSPELRRPSVEQQFHRRHAFRDALWHRQRHHRRHPRHAAAADLPC